MQTIHLLCATIFIGVVAFDVLIMEGVRKRLPASTMASVEEGIHLRGRHIMPGAIVTLYLTGIALVDYQRTRSFYLRNEIFTL